MMNARWHSRTFIIPAFIIAAALVSGCTAPPSETTSAKSETAHANGVATANAASTAVGNASMIDAREPERYRATLVLTARTTGGQQSATFLHLSAEVARGESARRYSFNIPGNRIVYLDRGDTRYVILPDRKQFSEVTPQTGGFDLPSLMTPGELVSFLRRLGGYERVGEEQINGRTAVKYRSVGAVQTGTQAGDMSAETFVYIDKETGLPLRTELFSNAEGSLRGGRGLKVITEVRDVRTDVDPSAFEVPAGLERVSEEQVRQQMRAVMNAASAVAGELLTGINGATTPTQATPEAR